MVSEADIIYQKGKLDELKERTMNTMEESIELLQENFNLIKKAVLKCKSKKDLIKLQEKISQDRRRT